MFDVVYLEKAEYIQHWKVRIGLDDAAAEARWNDDLDNADILKEGNEADGDLAVAVRLPKKVRGSKTIEHEHEVQRQKLEMNSSKDTAAVGRRMASFKNSTDCLFNKAGNECLMVGAASGTSRRIPSSQGLFSDDGAESDSPPRKRLRAISAHAANAPLAAPAPAHGARGGTASNCAASESGAGEDAKRDIVSETLAFTKAGGLDLS